MQHASSPVINPTREYAYWQREFDKQPYYRPELSYDDDSPAYRVGYTGPLRREAWPEAREATRAAWQRVAHGHPG